MSQPRPPFPLNPIVAALTAALLAAAPGQALAQEVTIGGPAGSNETRDVGTGSTLTGDRLIVGNNGRGELNVSDGGSASLVSDVFIAVQPGSSGVATVTDAGSSLTAGARLFVGYQGRGELSVLNGGNAVAQTGLSLGGNPGGEGVVTVTGTGSSLASSAWLYVGEVRRGEVTVSDGGTVSAQGPIRIGTNANSEGRVTVTGAGSSLTNGAANGGIYVGSRGRGELTISDGASASANTVALGDSAGSTGTATVTGASSSLAAGEDLFVGSAGSGELSVENGASASAVNNISIGRLAGSTGFATVTDAGSSLTAGNELTIGDNGNGELSVSGGASASASGRVWIGLRSGSTGTATVTGAGSSLTTAINLIVGGGDSSGELNVLDGASASAVGRVIVGNLSGSTGTATVTGAGSSLTADVNLTVGASGNGELNVGDGASASTSGAIFIGSGAGSTGVATVTGAGSSLTAGTNLIVGSLGSGELHVEDGASASASGLNEVLIGSETGSTGVATVTGAGSVLRANRIVVGNEGRGELTVSDGGDVGFLQIASQAGSNGLVTVGGAAGGPAAGAGTVNFGVRFGAGDGRLVFNHNSDGYGFTGTIGGTTAGVGRIVFEAGRTRFNTTDAGFTGISDIRSGATLVLNGDLMGTLNVLAGGELSGAGTIGALNVDGLVRMSGDNAATTFNGTSATFSAGSVLSVDFFGSNTDAIVLSGSANIANGAILRVTRPTGVLWQVGDRATVLSAAGGLTGQFTLEGAGTPLTAFLGLVDGYTATEAYVEIDLVRDFADAGQTSNQRAIAAGAQSLGTGALVFDAIANLPDDAAAQATFDTLSGELHPGVRGVLARDGYRLQQAIIRNSLDGGRETESRVWGEALTSSGSTDGDGNTASLDHDSTGLIVGADTVVGGGWRMGAALGYDQGDVASSRGQGRADLSRVSGLGYADGKLAGWILRGGLGYTDAGGETRRLATAGTVSETLESDHDGSVIHVYADASYAFSFEAGQVAPFLNLSHVAVETDGFAETGGQAALNVNKARTNLTFHTLGARASGVSLAGADLSGSLGWRLASGDREVTGVHAFSGGSDFQVQGAETARSAAVVEFDAHWTPSPALNIGAGAFFVGASDQSDYGARLSLRYHF